MMTKLTTVNFKSSKSIALSAFTIETNKAAGKAYVSTSLFKIFESEALNTLRLPPIYPKNIITKMGRMSLMRISNINFHFLEVKEPLRGLKVL